MSSPQPAKYYAQLTATSVSLPSEIETEDEFFENVPLPRAAIEDVDADEWADIARRVYPNVKVRDIAEGPQRWRVMLQALNETRAQDTSITYYRYRSAALLCLRLLQDLPDKVVKCMFGNSLAATVAEAIADEGAFSSLPFEALVEAYDKSNTELSFDLDSTTRPRGTFECKTRGRRARSLRGGASAGASPGANDGTELRRDWIIEPNEFVLVPMGAEQSIQWIDPVDERSELSGGDTYTASKFETPLRELVRKYQK